MPVIVAPGTVVNRAVLVFDGTSGSSVTDSPVTIDTDGNMAGAKSLGLKTSGGSAINGISRDSSDNILVGATSGGASLALDATTSAVVRIGGNSVIVQVGAGTVTFFHSDGTQLFKIDTNGFVFGTGAVVAKDTIADLTDETTGGTANTISDFAGAVYATDAPAIEGNFHQLALKVQAILDTLQTHKICL